MALGQLAKTYIWIDESKIGDSLKLNSRMERILLDLINGIKEMFKDATPPIFYHVFKKAGERKAKSLLRTMENMKPEDRSAGGGEELLIKVLGRLGAEGYFQSFELKLKHVDRKAALRVKEPFIFTLKRIAEDNEVELLDDEVSAIGRGLIAGILSTIAGLEIDAKKAVFYEKRGEVTYILSEKIYDDLTEL